MFGTNRSANELWAVSVRRALKCCVKYSPALQDSSVVWSEDTLARWLENPEALIPGQRMNLRVTDAADHASIIAYLKRESAP